ncbi:MAG: DUF6273 domain-containing protein [Lachnospiraceae bacterium]|nr:DUF6273 domain-containing protein [Lachnospiraceae bacterium]
MKILKKVGKLLVSALLVAVLTFPSLPVSAVAFTEKDETNTGLGTGSISNPAGADQWCYVYYGKYLTNGYATFPLKYRVLDKAATEFGGNTMFLDCEYVIGVNLFDDQSNVWAESAIREYLNGAFIPEHYFDAECFAMAQSHKEEPSSKDGSGYTGSDGGSSVWTPLNNGERIFLLDDREVTSSFYGYGNTQSNSSNRKKHLPGGQNATAPGWALRTAYNRAFTTDPQTLVIYEDGSFNAQPINQGGGGVMFAPAFNLNLSSILFSTLISGNAGAVGSEYKLTIKDENITAAVTSGESVSRDGDELTVPYTVSDGTNRISILITDGAYTPGMSNPPAMKCYCELSIDNDSIGTSGTGTVMLPDTFNEQTDVVYMLAEKLSYDDYLTDYASNLTELSFTRFLDSDDETEDDPTSDSKGGKVKPPKDGDPKDPKDPKGPKEPEELSDNYLDGLYKMIEDAIKEGGPHTLYWDQGTALPYDLMKILEEHPDITLVFYYTYLDNYYKVTISGKTFKANPEVEWYGPLYLHLVFAQTSTVTPITY